MGMKCLEILAPGKINLTLDVLAKRTDGYHEVKMVMQSISLKDRLLFSQREEGIIVTCNHPSVPTDETNLVYQAASMMQREYGIRKGVEIHIQKRIPVGAGLAGGSTDAAAALKGLNILWKLNLGKQHLLKMAARLGADVSFCLVGGTMLATGIGEKLLPLATLPELWLVLAKPNFSVSTAWAYQQLDTLSDFEHPHTQQMLEAITRSDRRAILQHLSNVLEQVTQASYPQIVEIKEQLLYLGAQGVLMSGSGPTVFGVMKNEAEAHQAADVLKKDIKEVFVAKTL